MKQKFKNRSYKKPDYNNRAEITSHKSSRSQSSSKQVNLKISQYSRQNASVGVSF